MTDDPVSFARFRWDGAMLIGFHDIAVRWLEDELLQKPDMTLREQSYFFRMARTEAQLMQRTDELKEVCRIVDKQADEISILNSKLDHQGTLTKERGAFIWKTLQTLERHWDAATLEEVDGVKLLMTEAPLEIRIKASAKNPYKLTSDAFAWAIRYAQEAGKKVKREISTIKKLRCLRFYADEMVPPRPEKRRRVHGEPRQVQDWAVGYTGFFREFLKDSYDPGG